ncbi:methyl-accepting chemotaxis sensory transducer, partial [mine drainage metagenome]
MASGTARATEDIASKIAAIQHDMADTINVISEIRGVIDMISDFRSSISSAVEEQYATTAEIVRVTQVSSTESHAIATAIPFDGEAAAATNTASINAASTADAFSKKLAQELTSLIGRFGGSST